MTLHAVVFLVLPVAVVTGLALMPPGGIATFVLAVLAALLGLIWLAWAFSWTPFTGVPRADTYALSAASLLTGAVVLGGIIHATRRLAPSWTRAVMLGAALLALAATLRLAA